MTQPSLKNLQLYDHFGAGVATFFAVPLMGLLGWLTIETLASLLNLTNAYSQSFVWYLVVFMVFSFLFTWIIILFCIPIAIWIVNTWGPTYRIALPIGLAAGLLTTSVIGMPPWTDPALWAGGVVGLIYVSTYTAFLRWRLVRIRRAPPDTSQ